MSRPLAIDLFCGLGGWTEGLLAEGYTVVGFDLERHVYGAHQYPAQLVLQDVLTIHGRQFKDAALIVASPPCQEFSYMAMPWSLAKQKIKDYESGVRDVKQLTALFDACFRIQREASEAAGQHIPLVVENVRGAQRWVGRARWHFGSFFLWGDVPALMPMTLRRIKHPGARLEKGYPKFRCEGVDGQKNPGFRFDGSGKSFQSESVERHTKNTGGLWFNIGSPGQKETGRNPVHEAVKVASESGRRTDIGNGARFTSRDCGVEGTKQRGSGREWFAGEGKISRETSSKSPARKAASAMIARIPLVLARHIAKAWHPQEAA